MQLPVLDSAIHILMYLIISVVASAASMFVDKQSSATFWFTIAVLSIIAAVVQSNLASLSLQFLHNARNDFVSVFRTLTHMKY